MENANIEKLLIALKQEDSDLKIVLRKIILDYQKCDIKYNANLDKLLCWILEKFSKSCETETRILLMNALCVLLKSLSKNQKDLVLIFIKMILFEPPITESFHFIVCILELLGSYKIEIQLYFIESILKNDILENENFKDKRFQLMHIMFDIAQKSCLSCEKITFVAFRCLQKLVLNFTKHNYWKILDKDVVSKILLIINSNWDNTVTGVRENNCKILNETLKNIDDVETERLFKETLIRISWLSKSKYFILTEIFKTQSCDHIFENYFGPDESSVLNLASFCDGLLSSLSAGGVISAGTNLFVEVWKSTEARKYLQGKILDILKIEPIK